MVIQGKVNGKRVSSRELEEWIQQAARDGKQTLTIHADGQHGIGGRIWPNGRRLKITVDGPAGQRLGSMGMSGTEIVVKGSVSDDVGWINCGAKITVLGDVTNGAHNAGAQGILYVQGGGGARCDTMTKFNPRFEPLQSWYFRDVGDSFAEFKAGGIAVVCGVDPRNPDNILGYRPCVGMVGGTIYFRGPIQGYSEKDVQCVALSPQDWEWLTKNIKPYLKAIDRLASLEELTRSPEDWKKLIAYTPAEKAARRGMKVPMSEFRTQVWDAGVGKGGIFGEYLEHDQTILPYITTDKNRRFRPVWRNDVYLPPCAYNCPSRIPSHKRASLIRQNRLEDALALVLQYSPFPASVCGQVCPNLCMDACTRGELDQPLDIKNLGSLSLEIPAPEKARATGKKVAIIGAGPAGLSTAWQLALKGHEVDLYEGSNHLGGKLEMCIPRKRLPQKILKKEISRFEEMGINVHLKTKVSRKRFKNIYDAHEVVVIGVGAHEARMVPFKGYEDVIPGIDFLKQVNYGEPMDFKKKDVVVIGAGNAGMDIACQAYACGARAVTAVDIQPPASFGKEQELARSKGTQILYPKSTERYDKKKKKVTFQDGTKLDADAVIMSIGEVPVLDFLPQSIHTERGYLVVNEVGQTTDLKVFGVGDATQPGLVTHAIGQGRIAADVIHTQMMNYDYVPEIQREIPRERIKTVYYEAARTDEFVVEQEANKCMSCGSCRDCGMCEVSCYYGAISRVEGDGGTFEYIVKDDLCIGCGFCAGICPCGIWEVEENV
jgi:NADPH-dependent glutamate synthase beta subunit-like oxidoreductase/glutamate synthase domain-containing protein 3/Pyruvate/2-oxoacid:ferredoxin oxidoreductase delta subunit